MSTATNLRAARALLVTRGWTQGNLVSGDGRLCTAAACWLSRNPPVPLPIFDLEEIKELSKTILNRNYELRYYSGTSFGLVTLFNDEIAKSVHDVLGLFDTTIERLEEVGL